MTSRCASSFKKTTPKKTRRQHSCAATYAALYSEAPWWVPLINLFYYLDSRTTTKNINNFCKYIIETINYIVITVIIRGERRKKEKIKSPLADFASGENAARSRQKALPRPTKDSAKTPPSPESAATKPHQGPPAALRPLQD